MNFGSCRTVGRQASQTEGHLVSPWHPSDNHMKLVWQFECVDKYSWEIGVVICIYTCMHGESDGNKTHPSLSIIQVYKCGI